MKNKEFVTSSLKKVFYFIIGFLTVVYFLEVLINFAVKKINVGEYGVLNKIIRRQNKC